MICMNQKYLVSKKQNFLKFESFSFENIIIISLSLQGSRFQTSHKQTFDALCVSVSSFNRVVIFGSKVDQIGTKWDKCGNLKIKFQFNLSHLVPILTPWTPLSLIRQLKYSAALSSFFVRCKCQTIVHSFSL